MAERPIFRPVDWLQDRLIRAVIGLLLLLPYRWRVPFCGWVVAHVVSPLAGYGRRVRQNLAQVLPDLPDAEVRRLMRTVPNNVGRSLIEIYSGAEFIARALNGTPHGPGLTALEAARRDGRAVILVSGHFGNYDAWRSALIARGYPIGALYRPMNNPWFNDHYVAAISVMGTPLFARGKQGMAAMIRHLRAGRMLGVLIDQHMARGARLQFFGREASTALSAADLALRYDALLIPTYAIRKANGLDFDILLEAPVAVGTAEAMTQALNDSLERMVRDHLDQWLWIHRRWKA